MQLSQAYVELEKRVDGLSAQAWRYWTKASYKHLYVFSYRWNQVESLRDTAPLTLY